MLKSGITIIALIEPLPAPSFAAAPPLASKTGLTHQELDLNRPLKVCCVVQYQDTGSKCFKSCKLLGWSFMDMNCLSSTPHDWIKA